METPRNQFDKVRQQMLSYRRFDPPPSYASESAGRQLSIVRQQLATSLSTVGHTGFERVAQHLKDINLTRNSTEVKP